MRIAVVGGGPAGIVCAKNAIERGHEVVVYEKLSALGGIWNPDSGGTYSGVRMQNSRDTFHFIDMGASSEETFLSVPAVHRYLIEFADRFGVTGRVRLETEVTAVAKTGGEWIVTSRSDATMTHEDDPYDCVVLAIGELWEPRSIELPGLAASEIAVTTSRDFEEPGPFAGQRVVVAGAGVSGIDIASELAETARTVTLSARRLGQVLPRAFPHGHGDTAFSYVGRMLAGEATRDEYRELLSLEGAEIRRYVESALFPAEGDNLAVHVNDRIIQNIDHGRVRLRPRMTAVDGARTVIFEDGSRAEVDALVTCAGYAPPDYSFVTRLRENELYEHIFWSPDPSLAVINPPIETDGYGAAFPYFDVVSRWVLAVFEEPDSLPDRRERERWLDRHRSSSGAKRFYDSWLETVRIGLRAGLIPHPCLDFEGYWSIVASVPEPSRLARRMPLKPGRLDHQLDVEGVRRSLIEWCSQPDMLGAVSSSLGLDGDAAHGRRTPDLRYNQTMP